MRRDCKGEPHIHPAAVPLYRCVQELLDLRESHNVLELFPNFCACHSKNCAIQKDIFASRQLRMESRPNLEQACDATLDLNCSCCGLGYPAEDLEESRFPCTVATDDAEHLAALDLKGNVAQGPEVLP